MTKEATNSGRAADLRKQAEKITRENAALLPENIEKMSPAVIKRTLHELQVHQIEVEMQNEELRLAGEELKALHERYFDLYDMAPVGYFTISEKGLIIEANLTIATLLGITKRNLVKQPLSRFISKEYQEIYYLHRNQLFETGKPQTCELRMVKKNKTAFWAYLEAIAAQDNQGKPVCRVTISDMSTRKKSEEALRESEERFDQLAMKSGTITWEVDFQGLYTYVSYVSETVLGYRPDELVGRMHFYDLHPESEREEFKKAAFAVFARKETFVNMENTAQTKEGRQVWLSTSGIPLLNHDGTLRGYHGSDTDITEKRQREVREIYSQKLESVGQLASGIAHELSTPLQFIGDNITFMQGAFQDILSIITMLDVLPDIDSPQLPSAHELIDRIHKKGEDVDLAYLKKEIPKAIVQSLDGLQRASKIVQAMREFSHPGGEGMVDLDINKSIESTITLSRNEWKYSAELIATLAPDLPTVQGYPADFNQAILNIILNAAQALQEKVGKGGPEKERIEIATRKDGNEVEICIRDTGPGIPQEIQSRVFDPFFTTKDVGKGTGQGLAIAHNIIVHKHGGKIYFETKLEEGTAFYIRLPLKTI